MKIKTFVFNPFGECTYLVWDPETLDAMVIDPGMSNERERQAFDSFIESHGLHLVHMVNTHLHLDHSWGNDHLADKYGLKTEANVGDAMLGERRQQQAMMFGMDHNGVRPLEIDVHLKAGDIIKVGNLKFKVIEVPGHSQGGIGLYDADEGVLFIGDSLFEGSIGRTDLPGGDHRTLINALQREVMTLPGSTVVYSGHGNPTTIAKEMATNPYL